MFPMRPHLSLDVHDVPQAVAFFKLVFDVQQQKQTVDSAMFDLHKPALNFSLVASTRTLSVVNHLGVEVDSTEAVAAWG